jgi:hypothetical protein
MHAEPSQRYTYALHWFSVARLLHSLEAEDAVINQEGALAIVCGLLSSVIFQRYASPASSTSLSSSSPLALQSTPEISTPSASYSSSCIPVQLLTLESQLRNFKTTLEKATPGPGCIPLLTPFISSMKALLSSHNIIVPSPFPHDSSSSSSSSSTSFEIVTRRRRGEALKNGAWLSPFHFFQISQEASLMMSYKDALIFSHTSSGRIRDFLLSLGEEKAAEGEEKETKEVAEDEETEEEKEEGATTRN